MPQYSLTLVSSDGQPGSSSSDFTIKYEHQLVFDGTWEVALVSATVPNTFFNISAKIGNNRLHYYDGTSNLALTIPDGMYSVAALSDYIQSQLGNTDITFAADPIRLRVYMLLSSNYEVDFTYNDTFRELLGFDPANYTTQNTKIYATNRPNITNNNDSFFIACDLINGSYSRVSGKQASVLYSFTFTVGQGSFQSIVPTERVHLPVARTYVDSINIKILNQAGQTVDLNGETVVVSLAITKVKPDTF